MGLLAESATRLPLKLGAAHPHCCREMTQLRNGNQEMVRMWDTHSFPMEDLLGGRLLRGLLICMPIATACLTPHTYAPMSMPGFYQSTQWAFYAQGSLVI